MQRRISFGLIVTVAMTLVMAPFMWGITTADYTEFFNEMNKGFGLTFCLFVIFASGIFTFMVAEEK